MILDKTPLNFIGAIVTGLFFNLNASSSSGLAPYAHATIITSEKISILIPAYNEEGVVRPLCERISKLSHDIKNYKFEFLFIDDGSKDRTLEIIEDLASKDSNISYLNLSRNFGKEIAMIADLDHVSGDATIIIDADLQDPPELIPIMIYCWADGYDDV